MRSLRPRGSWTGSASGTTGRCEISRARAGRHHAQQVPAPGPAQGEAQPQGRGPEDSHARVPARRLRLPRLHRNRPARPRCVGAARQHPGRRGPARPGGTAGQPGREATSSPDEPARTTCWDPGRDLRQPGDDRVAFAFPVFARKRHADQQAREALFLTFNADLGVLRASDPRRHSGDRRPHHGCRRRRMFAPTLACTERWNSLPARRRRHADRCRVPPKVTVVAGPSARSSRSAPVTCRPADGI